MAGSSCGAVLVLVCGLPAAGKTTLVKHLVARGSTPSRLYERISFDDLYERLVAEDATTEFDPEKWKTCQQAMVVRVSRRLEQHNGAMQQLVLLVDDNFQYRSLRKRFFHLATERNCGFGLLYVNIPARICRERNVDRSKDGSGSTRVPDEVFERMVTIFEAPNGHQSAWEVNTCELNLTGAGFDIEEVMTALLKQAERELKERCSRQVNKLREEAQQHRDRQATQQNILHLVDLQLRKWISTRLRDERVLPSNMTMAQLASQLNQRRKNYLTSLKRSPNEIADRLQDEAIDVVVVSLVLRFQQLE